MERAKAYGSSLTLCNNKNPTRENPTYEHPNRKNSMFIIKFYDSKCPLPLASFSLI